MVRIRKNLTHSALKYCSNLAPQNFQAHICRLNQSRWDVDLPPVFEGQNGLNVSGSVSDATRATKSFALSSEMDVDKVIINLEDSSSEDEATKSFTLPANMDIDNDNVTIIEVDHELNKQKICNRNDGKGWNCKKEVEFGYSFCKHHLTLIRNHNSNIAPNKSISTLKKSKMAMENNNTPEANAEKGSSNSGDFSCHITDISSKLVKNMQKMVIAGGSGAATSSATAVALEIDPLLPVEVGYEDQVGSVEVDEVKANVGNLRKRSRKMKNPVRATIGLSTFSTDA